MDVGELMKGIHRALEWFSRNNAVVVVGDRSAQYKITGVKKASITYVPRPDSEPRAILLALGDQGAVSIDTAIPKKVVICKANLFRSRPMSVTHYNYVSLWVCFSPLQFSDNDQQGWYGMTRLMDADYVAHAGNRFWLTYKGLKLLTLIEDDEFKPANRRALEGPARVICMIGIIHNFFGLTYLK
jgi:hypothetical protein